MGRPTGFKEYARQPVPYRDCGERIHDFLEIHTPADEDHLRQQGARCMDCGVPFCQSEHGCPIDNLIPEWNDLVYEGRWKAALDRLHKTNNFPEFTGRTCPAPCEGACVLGISDPPVTIKNIENAIIDRGFAEGWVMAQPPATRTSKRVAIVGSGPAGLAAAAQLNRVGHLATVFERADRIGGLLMYGIPNMKLDKSIVERRVQLLREEGITFVTRTHVGRPRSQGQAARETSVECIALAQLRQEFDAVVLAVGARQPRDLEIPGRQLAGIHFAMEYLTQSTQHLLEAPHGSMPPIHAGGKRVIVIGGGDTGTDCIGTALRQGCLSLVNFELLPQPPDSRAPNNPWPTWPRIHRIDYGHAEAAAKFGSDPRTYALLSKQFLDNGRGNVAGVRTVRLNWSQPSASGPYTELPDSEQSWEADLILLALGFLGPEPEFARHGGIALDARTNFQSPLGSFATNLPGVFAAGDCRRGQSLVVWAIQEGRSVAREVDEYLMGQSTLPIIP